MHFCMDEVMMFLAALPFVGYALTRARHALHRLRGHRRLAHEDGCCRAEDHTR